MNRKKTPVIVRENSDGKITGLIPTMIGGNFTDTTRCQLLNSRGRFGKAESCESFMARTTDTSATRSRQFIELVSDNYAGRYYAIKHATKAMHTQRLTRNNPELEPQD